MKKLLVVLGLMLFSQQVFAEQELNQYVKGDNKDNIIMFFAGGCVTGLSGLLFNPPNRLVKSADGTDLFLKAYRKTEDGERTKIYIGKVVRPQMYNAWPGMAVGTLAVLGAEEISYGKIYLDQAIFGIVGVLAASTGMVLAYNF